MHHDTHPSASELLIAVSTFGTMLNQEIDEMKLFISTERLTCLLSAQQRVYKIIDDLYTYFEDKNERGEAHD